MKRTKLLFATFILCGCLAACGEAPLESSASERSIVESSEPTPSETAAADPVQTSSEEVVVIVSEESSVQESSSEEDLSTESSASKEDTVYVLNTKSMKIHNTWCNSVEKIDPENYEETTASVEDLEKLGYTKCKQKGDWSK